jgi:hypothetical protein
MIIAKSAALCYPEYIRSKEKSGNMTKEWYDG